MIDLHSHILPGVDDSVESYDDAMDMVRTAMADGIQTIVCTPRMGASMDNRMSTIRRVFDKFSNHLKNEGYPIRLRLGADISFHDDILQGLRKGELLTLNNSRYFLVRLPFDIYSDRYIAILNQCLKAGYVPIITHPERLNWLSEYYDRLQNAVVNGCWLQVTGDSLTGHMGKAAKYWSERLLSERMVHVIATDAHITGKREALLSESYAVVVQMLGKEEADHLIVDRPKAVLANIGPKEITLPYNVNIFPPLESSAIN